MNQQSGDFIGQPAFEVARRAWRDDDTGDEGCLSQAVEI